ncbi:MAG TPA: DUF6602 domain-containing protein [Anaerolineales bacterium]|jgi:hypothetical protein
MNLKEVFVAIEARMLSDFKHFQTQILHYGERGGERETALNHFLELYLPKKYTISSGEIVDIDGKVSHQSDIIIYDSSKCPLLLAGENYRVFPCEPVLAVIEVKSTLTKAELVDAAEKISAAKDLTRSDGPIAGIVFAYKSGFRKDPVWKTTTILKQINESLQPHQFIDLICLLDSGVIYLLDDNGYCGIPKDLSKRVMFSWAPSIGPNTLLWFFLNLLSLLNGQTASEPNFLEYIGGGELGFVMKSNL